jgi:hypothetical protein
MPAQAAPPRDPRHPPLSPRVMHRGGAPAETPRHGKSARDDDGRNRTPARSRRAPPLAGWRGRAETPAAAEAASVLEPWSTPRTAGECLTSWRPFTRAEQAAPGAPLPSHHPAGAPVRARSVSCSGSRRRARSPHPRSRPAVARFEPRCRHLGSPTEALITAIAAAAPRVPVACDSSTSETAPGRRSRYLRRYCEAQSSNFSAAASEPSLDQVMAELPRFLEIATVHKRRRRRRVLIRARAHAGGCLPPDPARRTGYQTRATGRVDRATRWRAGRQGRAARTPLRNGAVTAAPDRDGLAPARGAGIPRARRGGPASARGERVPRGGAPSRGGARAARRRRRPAAS